MDIPGFQFIESMFMSHTAEAETSVISFAKYFSSYPLNTETAQIYQKIISYNNSAAIDALLKNRNPGSFFSTINPSRELVSFAFSTLTDYRSGELYVSSVLICLGILQNTYKNPEYGVSIYPLTVSELYHVSKYLKVENEEIDLTLISFLGDLSNLSKMNNIASLSRNIINAYYDDSKKIENIIPASIFSD